jgi:hypothetical protein
VCAQYLGWINQASEGYITVRLLQEGRIDVGFSRDLISSSHSDLFPHLTWTLESDNIGSMEENVKDGAYRFTSTACCSVISKNDNLKSKIWFTTPVRVFSSSSFGYLMIHLFYIDL